MIEFPRSVALLGTKTLKTPLRVCLDRSMQLFRFASAVVIVVVVSLAGIAQEKRHLSLTRTMSLQQYRMDQLLEQQAHLRFRIHELTSPVQSSPVESTHADSSHTADSPARAR